MSLLLPALHTESDRTALRFGERTLSYRRLAAAAGETAALIGDSGRIAVWATPALETAVAVVAALQAGVPVVPLNPRSGERELEHVVADSAPSAVLAEPEAELPEVLGGTPRIDVVVSGEAETTTAWSLAPEPNAESAALIVYTSGTTGSPKGVVLSRRAVACTLDALEDAWQWTADDVVVHALPLFHVHGLVLGLLGPLRRGGSLHHLVRFSPEAVASALAGGGTMLFGVPTMYHRLAEALGSGPEPARALSGARLLVSGSAPLLPADHRRIHAATGRHVIERYGMTETLMNTSVRADGDPRPGTVGVPLRDVDLRLVDEAGNRISTDNGADAEAIGEVQVRGPNLFTEYLNRPDATAGAFDGGWFRTGDIATQDADGHLRLVGRKATDLIKSGGYKIGAGEIENVLLSHPGVAEAAVTAAPDPDLGERVVAWVVPSDPAAPPLPEELADFVARQLAPHKRPRTVHFREDLPRNDMGKVLKRALTDPPEETPAPGG
ncbi:acyl-CoA synthetase [Streptomyces abyssalis]|uniref:Acyl-CoA synthetase n=1 Tax=Streptomyces abyssalis TaxID=933944 RepID=A0A1E7JT17_9ACTN|nr:acyl-CoA synthetase [Streptomyces abyssalis]OEU92044.1 acyl-CoA synthetase [Streptomyces abyssalis]OEU94678.1 acyl-CoA synthetase [Streptomyces abyssalis]